MRDVTVGLSKTYLVGEKALIWATWYKSDCPEPSIFDSSGHEYEGCARNANTLPLPDTIYQNYSDKTSSYPLVVPPFGSAHTSAWNCVFCDGSVHRLSYNISYPTHYALSTRAGGETPDPKEY